MVITFFLTLAFPFTTDDDDPGSGHLYGCLLYEKPRLASKTAKEW